MTLTFDWSGVRKNQKVEWRSAITTHMVQCVMTSGMSWRPEWSVDNWDTLEMVGYESIG